MIRDLHEDYLYLPNITSTTNVVPSEIDYLMEIY